MWPLVSTLPPRVWALAPLCPAVKLQCPVTFLWVPGPRQGLTTLPQEVLQRHGLDMGLWLQLPCFGRQWLGLHSGFNWCHSSGKILLGCPSNFSFTALAFIKSTYIWVLKTFMRPFGPLLSVADHISFCALSVSMSTISMIVWVTSLMGCYVVGGG